MSDPMPDLRDDLFQHLRELTTANRLPDAAVRETAARLRGVDPADAEDLLARLANVYRDLPPTDPGRTRLLQLLAECRTPAALALLAELLATAPPASAEQVAAAIAPLFQKKNYDPRPLFPRLLDALHYPAATVAVLDLANFLTREKLVDRHPAGDRVSELTSLLGAIAGRLGRLESHPPADEAAAREAGRQVAEGIPIAVALCDALAWIGDPAAIGKLHQAAAIGHRRLKTEAAAALARLGEAAGAEMLLALAAEPVARLRAIAYAAELGVQDKLDEILTSPQARAEAELALWLAQPENMGLPPVAMEPFDSAKMYWPSYDEPVECFLIRFSYRLDGTEFSNVGIAGPLTHAFAADLSDLPPADLYAAFAGWQAEHEDIFEIDADRLNDRQQIVATRLERRLQDEGYQQVRPSFLALFFGEPALVARASRSGQPGIAIIRDEEIAWFPARGSRPLGPDEAYCIVKGRQLLTAFNP